MTGQEGPCKKCTKKIPLRTERCPQCGYEPGKLPLGALGAILGAVLLFAALFQIFLSLVVIFGGIIELFSALFYRLSSPAMNQTGNGFSDSIDSIAGGLIFFVISWLQALIGSWLGKFGSNYAAEKPDTTYINAVTGEREP